MKNTLSALGVAVVIMAIPLFISRPSHITSPSSLPSITLRKSIFYVTRTGFYTHQLASDSQKTDGICCSDYEIYFTSYPAAAGTYPLIAAAAGTTNPGPGSDSCGSPVCGSVAITSVSPDLVGSFLFTSGDSIHITGYFDVPPSPLHAHRTSAGNLIHLVSFQYLRE